MAKACVPHNITAEPGHKSRRDDLPSLSHIPSLQFSHSYPARTRRRCNRGRAEIRESLVTGSRKKLALIAFAGLFAASGATALPISIQPEIASNNLAVNPAPLTSWMGTSGEGPTTEVEHNGLSIVYIDSVAIAIRVKRHPANAGCDGSPACDTTSVPEPGTWLLLIAGLLGLALKQGNNG